MEEDYQSVSDGCTSGEASTIVKVQETSVLFKVKQEQFENEHDDNYDIVHGSLGKHLRSCSI